MKLSIIVVSLLLLINSGGDVRNTTAPKTDFNQVETESLIRTHGLKINVDDMKKALAFYTEKLAFEVEDHSGYPDYVVLKSGDREKLILNRVKKLATVNPTDTQLSFTLQVNNLDRAIERMKSLGVEFGEKERRKEAVGDAIFIKDPFGRRISLMHQTIVKTEPFKEPKIYNFGYLVPDMQIGRDFYSNKLGFVVRSERYLPKDLPLGHKNKSFAFMLHFRPGVASVQTDYPRVTAFNTLVFETSNLAAATEELKKNGVKILSENKKGRTGNYVLIVDPFGNVFELLEVVK
jgi:predicted enzyme related to lactoylglutathione lyase